MAIDEGNDRCRKPIPNDAEPAAVIDAFLRAGCSVCVPALRVALAGQISYQVLPGNGKLQGPVYKALRAFLAANALERESPDYKMACILIDRTEDITATAQRERAFAIQEEVHVAVARLNSWLPFDWVHRGSAHRDLAVSEFPGVRGGECRGKDVIRFAMGPRYSLNHRRYAPRLIVPITAGDDAGWFHENRPEDVRQTYLAIQRRTGEMLNAMAYYEDVDPA